MWREHGRKKRLSSQGEKGQIAGTFFSGSSRQSCYINASTMDTSSQEIASEREKPQAQRPKRVWLVLAAIAVGVSVAALEDLFAVTLFPFGPYIGELINWHGNAGYLVLLLLAPIYWLIVAVHEAAHSVAGVMTGLSWQGVALGRVLILKRKRGVRLRWETQPKRGRFCLLLLSAAGAPSVTP